MDFDIAIDIPIENLSMKNKKSPLYLVIKFLPFKGAKGEGLPGN